jgi:pyruvate dehydrogenase E2 component (dihydrolipoamide acetyltransferase)
MAVEVKLPDLGENIESGDVISVLVAPGDTVSQDQPVIELETDKAVIEVPCPRAGVVEQVLVQVGDTAEVGQAILALSEDAVGGTESAAGAPAEVDAAGPAQGASATGAAADADVQSADAPADAAPAGSSTMHEFVLPDLGESVESGEVVNVLVQVGDQVTADQPVIELETDKAVVEVPAPMDGIVRTVHVHLAQTLAVGQAVISLETSAAPPAAAGSREPSAAAPPAVAGPQEPSAAAPPAAAAAQPQGPSAAPAALTLGEETPRTYPAPAGGQRKLVPAAPSVRRLAREIGIDISAVPGTGPAARISDEDVKAFARELNSRRQQTSNIAAPGAGPGVELPDFSQWGEVERKPVSRIRRITAERLQASWQTIPMVTQFDKADLTDLEKWRKELAPRVEQAGGKLTPTAIIIKVVGAALKVFPQFNTSYDQANGEIIQKHYVHIGIAVDTPHGLLVPVVRNVDQKNITELAVELVEMAAKTRSRKVAPQDMQGGSMTISNVGTIGGTGFTPIINPPEVAILGIARSNQEPVYIDGQFQPRLMLPLSLSYDHRVIDGADGARFLRWVADALANPLILALEG